MWPAAKDVRISNVPDPNLTFWGWPVVIVWIAISWLVIALVLTDKLLKILPKAIQEWKLPEDWLD